MNVRSDIRRRSLLKLSGMFFRLALIGLSPLWLFTQQAQVGDAPGPLSQMHAESPGVKNCALCHTAEFEVDPAKCLKCHKEISIRIEARRGFHKDKAAGCRDCHGEHRGEAESLIPLDPREIDHDETGFVLQGAHQGISDCRWCHNLKTSFPRTKSQSYLLKGEGCTLCHDSPHPGRQEQCLACHDFTSWRVSLPSRSNKPWDAGKNH